MPATEASIRFLQLSAFYGGFLEDFYTQHPDVATQPYTEQVDTLVASGFSAPHIISKALADAGLDAMQVVINAAQTQLAWWRDNVPGKDPSSLEDIG